ncbi:pyridoxamine 5'-phosphate oxidase family protein [Streptomyces sp. NPDC002018]|uniref:pyridoxamine 5'-phosphate oxidase family protein n=1 Tax=Streptomyces sp. NPDC002018 TaxID=3364629 RepID=UPI0036B23A88
MSSGEAHGMREASGMREDAGGDGPRPEGGPTHQADLGRRAEARRRELGLTRADVALRSGAAPEYIRYVEERSATPGIGFLLRLAYALDTTVAELTGATADLPAGTGEAAHAPELVTLDAEECRELLSTHGVGRVTVTLDDEPAVFPVNYTVDGDLVAFRTAADAAPAAAAGCRTAFEVDHIDDALSQGWSVLLVGTAQRVTDPRRVRGLEERAHTAPWAGGDRGLWIAVTPARITGRRILTHHGRPAGAPPPHAP